MVPRGLRVAGRQELQGRVVHAAARFTEHAVLVQLLQRIYETVGRYDTIPAEI